MSYVIIRSLFLNFSASIPTKSPNSDVTINVIVGGIKLFIVSGVHIFSNVVQRVIWRINALFIGVYLRIIGTFVLVYHFYLNEIKSYQADSVSPVARAFCSCS